MSVGSLSLHGNERFGDARARAVDSRKMSEQRAGGAASRGELVSSWPLLPTRAPPLAAVRSTIVTSGLAALRARSLETRYLGHLPREHHAAVESLIAGMWLTTDFVMAHYQACEALNLPFEEAVAIGTAVGARVHETLLITVKKLAAAAGVTPWTVLSQYDRLWQRTFDGGGFTITRTGPKDALVHVTQMPLARFAYFRASYCGVNLAGLRLFATNAYVRLLPHGMSDHSYSFRASWV
jgi:hypothetical protein